MTTDKVEAREHLPTLPPGTAPLWAGLLGAPAAWSLQMLVNYSIAPKVDLDHRRLLVHITSLVCLLVAIVCGIICLDYRRRMRGEESDGGDNKSRTRFLALLGTLSSALYALVIVAQMIATVMLDSSIF